MSDITARVLTVWTGDGMNVPYHPAGDDSFTWERWEDRAGQDVPADPNVCVVDVWCSAAVLAAMEASNEVYVVWDTPNPKKPHGAPTAAEFNKMRVWLRKHMSNSQVDAAVGTAVNGRARWLIGDSLAGWLKTPNPQPLP